MNSECSFSVPQTAATLRSYQAESLPCSSHQHSPVLLDFLLIWLFYSLQFFSLSFSTKLNSHLTLLSNCFSFFKIKISFIYALGIPCDDLDHMYPPLLFCSASPGSVPHVPSLHHFEILARAVRQRKEMKGIQVGK